MTAADRWQLRDVPAELVARYVEDGWWTDTTLGELIARSVAAQGSNPVRVYSDVHAWSGTFDEVDRDARSLAASLRASGVGPGDVIAMQLPNWVEAAVTFWASAYLGAVIVPIVHFYGAKEVDYILRTVQPEVVITPDVFRGNDFLSMYEPLVAALPEATWLVAGNTPASDLPKRATPIERLLDGERIEHPTIVDPDTPVLAAFTSGTTSDPKGVLHTHRTLNAEMLQQTAKGMVQGGPPFITGAPIGHFAGMLGALLRPLMTNTSIHLLDVWDPKTVLRLMLSEGLSMGGGATYFLTSILDHPDFSEAHLEYMPVCGLGGSPVPVAVAERAAALGITVFRSYGCTEHPSVTGCSPLDDEIKRLTTDGRPLGGVEIRLDEDGQIFTRGPELCAGYTDPKLTASAFDADGWYRTGDVGMLDDDGFLAITDRVSDVIIRGGENISAQEVEEVFLTIDGIAEVAVVAEPDPRLGEHAAAVFTVRAGASAPTPDQVRAHLERAGLARQKWPQALYEVRDLPRTPSGKVQKFRLRQQLREGTLENRV
jgi:acyl-CoA synthetase (AMP-forming)/AMP-acid ligase II